MKYCTFCGSEMIDEAVLCVKCGRMIETAQAAQQGFSSRPAQTTDLSTITKIFMIVGMVLMAISTFGIALAWCIPMYNSYIRKTQNMEPITTGFKICTLFFVSTISGILMLCDKNN